MAVWSIVLGNPGINVNVRSKLFCLIWLALHDSIFANINSVCVFYSMVSQTCNVYNVLLNCTEGNEERMDIEWSPSA